MAGEPAAQTSKPGPVRDLTHEALIEFLVPRMPRYWVPRFVEFTDQMPRTLSFKLKKAELRDAGITPATWDREAAGIKLKREQLNPRSKK